LVFLALNLLLTLIGVFPILAVPLAGGPGIPEVKAALNGVRIPGAFNIHTILAKTLSLIGSFPSSLTVGPEGPMVHIGASIGAAVSQGLHDTVVWLTRLCRQVRHAQFQDSDFPSVPK
jgi:chloride channel 7